MHAELPSVTVGPHTFDTSAAATHGSEDGELTSNMDLSIGDPANLEEAIAVGILAAFLSRRTELIGYTGPVTQMLLAHCTDLQRDPYIQDPGLPNSSRC